MEFKLPELPYPQDALEPVISRRTLFHHYEKHHAGYVSKLEKALDDKSKDQSLEEIIMQSYKQENATVFNPAAQVWNHTFYWHSMTPDDVGIDDPKLQALVDTSFGSTDQLLQKFKEVAAAEFGSGWAWLLYDPSREALSITSTTDAENPLPGNKTPLLTLDVWEHAYYLDYQQDRAAYLDGVLEKHLNWAFASSNLAKALK